MSAELQDLLSYVIELKEEVLIKKIAFMILKYSIEESDLAQAKSVLPNEFVDIDLWELESLVYPDKFEFPEPSIGQINVES